MEIKPPPAEIERLRDTIERLRDAIECAIVELDDDAELKAPVSDGPRTFAWGFLLFLLFLLILHLAGKFGL